MYTETKPGSLTTIVNVESTNVTKQKKNLFILIENFRPESD